MNKYKRTPEHILDLHGFTTRESEGMLDLLLEEKKYIHVRIITGKGLHRETGPVLKNFVRSYLVSRNIKFSQSKISDGGEGAFEVYLR